MRSGDYASSGFENPGELGYPAALLSQRNVSEHRQADRQIEEITVVGQRRFRVRQSYVGKFSQRSRGPFYRHRIDVAAIALHRERQQLKEHSSGADTEIEHPVHRGNVISVRLQFVDDTYRISVS